MDKNEMTEEMLEELKMRESKPIGKYAAYRENYLRESQPEYYAELVQTGEIVEHLWSVVDRAKALKERIMEQQKAASEEWQEISKTNAFIEKVRLLRQFEMVADEIVCNDILYV